MTSDNYRQFDEEFGVWITGHGAEFTAEQAPYDRLILNWLSHHGVELATVNGKPAAGHINEQLLRDGVSKLRSLGSGGGAYRAFAHLDLGRLRTAIQDLIAEARAEIRQCGECSMIGGHHVGCRHHRADVRDDDDSLMGPVL